MPAPPSDPATAVLWFGPEDRGATQDLFQVCERLGAVIDPGPGGRDQMRSAFTGAWDVYEGHLRQLGTELAVAGVGFGAWCETLAAFQHRVLPALVETHAATPARLTAALQALTRFAGASSTVVGEQYLAAKQLLVNEVRQENEDVRERSRQIQEANRLKSEFLANMSHELRTPLNAIIGFAELIHDGVVEPGSPQQREFLNHILASGRHLLQLINDVLDLAKVESGKLEFHPERLSLPTVVNEVLSILRTTAAHKHIELQSQLDPELDELYLDAARLKQVLYNYLSNALKFTPEGGRVTLRAVPEGPAQFRIEVEDTGIGIQPADLDRLWSEFQQLDNTHTKQHQGTGLGLALTRRLVEAQGGSVGVTSSLGAGSCFRASLPRRVSAAVPPAAGAVTGGGGGPTILVVEDNPADRDLIAGTLAGAGYDVVCAGTVAEAIERCRSQRFGAITLDLLLPDGSGIDALREIRKQAGQSDTPVVVVTVSADRKIMAGFAVTDVLPKPLDTGALLGTLERVGVKPQPGGTVLVLDDDHRALELMSAALGQLGFRCRCTGDGHKALRWAGEQMPLAVIVDVLMPGMNGFEFLERFRALPASRQVPVIVWTIKDLTGHERATLRMSSQAVVPKSGSAALIDELRTFLPVPAPRTA